MIEPRADGVRIRIRAQPRASRSEVVGPYGGDAVKIRLAAPPVDGEANAELVKLLSKVLGVPKRRIRIAAGATGKSKLVEVDGLSPEAARAALGV